MSIRSIQRFKYKYHLQVIALFASAAGLAVDCVRQNHPEYLPKLMEGIADVIEDELTPWINDNGGWVCLIIMQSDIMRIMKYFYLFPSFFAFSHETARLGHTCQSQTESILVH